MRVVRFLLYAGAALIPFIPFIPPDDLLVTALYEASLVAAAALERHLDP